MSLLALMGWESLDESTIEIFTKHPRLIIVYPHTSSADMWISYAYIHDEKILRNKCRTVVGGKCVTGPQGWVMRRMGALGISGKSGCTEQIIKEIKPMKEFILPLSPKGTIYMAKWRSGYYHIAKELDCHITVGGLDYHQKRFILNEPFKIGDMTIEQVEEKCKSQFRHMTPMHAMSSEMPIDSQIIPLSTSLMNDNIIVTVVMIVLLLVLVLCLMDMVRMRKE